MSNPAEQFNMQTPDWSSLTDLSDTSLDCLMNPFPKLSPSFSYTGPISNPFSSVLQSEISDLIPEVYERSTSEDSSICPVPDESWESMDYDPFSIGYPSFVLSPLSEKRDLTNEAVNHSPVPSIVLESEHTQVLIDEDLQIQFLCPGCQFWHDKYSRVLKALVDLVGVELNPGPPKKQNKPKKPQTKMVKSRIGRLTQINNPTQARAAPGRNPNPRTMSMGLQHLGAYMRCLNDPFNEPPARPGVGCALPTGLMTCYLRYLLTTTGGGSGSFVFVPSRMASPIMSSGTTSAPYTYGSAGNDYPQKTAIAALYEKVRLLASGVRIMPTMNSTNDAGSISTALIPGLRAADVTNFGQVSTGAATIGYQEYPNFAQTLVSPFKVGATILWRPQDPNSFVFREGPLTDTVSSIGDSLQNQPFMVAGFSGTAGSATWIVEFIAHYEGTIAGGNAGVVDLQRAPPTSDLQALKAADLVFGTDNRTTFPGYLDTMISASAKAGRNIGRNGLNKQSLLGSLGDFTSSVAGPLLGSLAALF